MPLAEGFLLHQRYRIEKTIATGGMGAVYRAQDEILNIAVAVKENFFTTEEFSRQFRREATIQRDLALTVRKPPRGRRMGTKFGTKFPSRPMRRSFRRRNKVDCDLRGICALRLLPLQNSVVET